MKCDAKAIRKEWAERGLCPNCGARPPYEGRTLCETCLRTQRENRRSRRAALPDEFRDEYHARKETGVCTRCGRVPPRPGYNVCAGCSAADRQRGVRVKKGVMEKYGGKCACCGEAHIAFLTLDHVNDDGFRRRAEGEGGGGSLYRKLLQAPVDPSLQVMCFNCNCGRRATGVCPHKNDTYYTEALERKPHAHTQPQWELHGQLALPFWSEQFRFKRTRLEIQVSAERVLAFVASNPGLRTEEVRKHLGIEHKPWNHMLGYLRKAGKIRGDGHGRGMTIRTTSPDVPPAHYTERG